MWYIVYKRQFLKLSFCSPSCPCPRGCTGGFVSPFEPRRNLKSEEKKPYNGVRRKTVYFYFPSTICLALFSFHSVLFYVYVIFLRFRGGERISRESTRSIFFSVTVAVSLSRGRERERGRERKFEVKTDWPKSNISSRR